MESEKWILYAAQSMDGKDRERVMIALSDKTLLPAPEQAAKKVAHVKASKQHFVGMIVGKKGSNIMQKRNQTNTEVQNPQQEEEPLFRVTGDNYHDLLDMCLWILRQDDRLNGKDGHNDCQKMEAKIWCCSKYVGLLVGPNGETIRQIKDVSQCGIQSPPRNEVVKCFTVTGSFEEIQLAYTEMWKLIEKKFRTDNSSHVNSYKTCDCVNGCERLKLIISDESSKGAVTPPYQSAYSTTPPTPAAPSTPAFPFSVPTDSPPDPIVMELCRQMYLAKVASPQEFIHPHYPSPTIPGSRVFSGGKKSNSSGSSSLSSPALKLPSALYRHNGNMPNMNFEKIPSPSYGMRITQPIEDVSETDQEALLQQLLHILQLNQNQEPKAPYPIIQKQIRESPDFGKRFNSFNREMPQRGSYNFGMPGFPAGS